MSGHAFFLTAKVVFKLLVMEIYFRSVKCYPNSNNRDSDVSRHGKNLQRVQGFQFLESGTYSKAQAEQWLMLIPYKDLWQNLLVASMKLGRLQKFIFHPWTDFSTSVLLGEAG